MSLIYIGQQLTIYVGLFLFIAGIFGNGVNIYIFSSDRVYRTTPSIFYFLSGSICNAIYILVILTTRIISAGFGIDWTLTSLVWCRMRQYLTSTLSLISFTCACLSTIDQFLVTSKNASIRRLSKIQYAHRIVAAIIPIWCLHGIPFFLYYNISPITKSCSDSNIIYRTYLTTYTIVILCAVPVLVNIVFGCLTYRNIRQTVALVGEQADRQVVKMTLIQIILIVISVTPPGIYLVYALLTTGIVKDLDRQLKEIFASTIIGLTSYFYYIVSLGFSLD
jgi:hypothetical protein